ncbi:hypothetical protein niasHT_021393 [Heterodera trifolii]|uniref:Uncharacterized protein n=1 Tax=Heterodera trifolii TaxID=157864 RepID=A0ABD2K6L6_9BILA
MAETVWETMANGAVPCLLLVCWKLVFCTNPDTCLPHGANPHTSENYSLLAISFLWLLLAAFVRGLCFGIFGAILVVLYKCLTGRRYCFGSHLRRSRFRSPSARFDPLFVPTVFAV